jgi:hypothetical protein
MKQQMETPAFYDTEPPWAMLLSDIFLRLSDTIAGFNNCGGEAMTDDLSDRSGND